MSNVCLSQTTGTVITPCQRTASARINAETLSYDDIAGSLLSNHPSFINAINPNGAPRLSYSFDISKITTCKCNIIEIHTALMVQLDASHDKFFAQIGITSTAQLCKQNNEIKYKLTDQKFCSDVISSELLESSITPLAPKDQLQLIIQQIQKSKFLTEYVNSASISYMEKNMRKIKHFYQEPADEISEFFSLSS